MKPHEYSQRFYDFVEKSSGRSASSLIEALNLGYPIKSILDIGCGRGIWLKAWQDKGIEDILGIDGEYVEKNTLCISPEKFMPLDITIPFNLNKSFDLVECLEVAEHISESAATTLINSIVIHGNIILFSAATPGQGGEHHVNEQPLEYWAEHFEKLGYHAFDYPRKCIQHLHHIEPWYRYNCVIYANHIGEKKLAPEVLACKKAPGDKFKSMTPFYWRLRCLVIRNIPFPLVNLLARIKHFFSTMN